MNELFIHIAVVASTLIGAPRGPLEGDANFDGRVDWMDMNAVLANWGKVSYPLPVYRVYHLPPREAQPYLSTIIWIDTSVGIENVMKSLQIPDQKYIGFRPGKGMTPVFGWQYFLPVPVDAVK